ncbi:unnamed protein product [Ilex paraguariensis]|uniref:MADS-box domain-containing protein n=1 Tax=Ilex paraguariensis TaxID=185542 RepID=A0ABC8QZR8_9AQUA
MKRTPWNSNKSNHSPNVFKHFQTMALDLAMARTSKGRQKVNMVKMQNESNLQVTFSKRRSGLFKKASELCTLCGAEVAIIVFSPGKKVFSFGHPCVESVVDRFLSRNPPQPNGGSGAELYIEAHRNAKVHELNMQLTHVESQLEGERKRGEMLDQIRRAGRNQRWWEAPIDELNLQQLEILKAAMEDLRENFNNQAQQVMVESSIPSPFLTATSSFGRGGSATGFGLGAPFNAAAPGSSGGGAPPFNARPAVGFSGGGTGGGPFDARATGSIPSMMSHGYNHGYGHGHGHGFL